MGQSYSYLAVKRTSLGYHLIKRTCEDAIKGSKEIEEANTGCQGNSVMLRVKISNGAVCNFSYSSGGKEFIQVGKTFIAQPGKWIGAKVGLFCLAQNTEQKQGYADYDWFRFE